MQIPESELEERFIRSSGPGGQNVNKVASAVQLRFDVLRSPSLSAEIRQRLIKIAGRRVNSEGVLIIVARTHREQERNRAEARQRLVDLLNQAAIKPVIRRKTRPTKASRLRRLTGKLKQGQKKQRRRANWGE